MTGSPVHYLQRQHGHGREREEEAGEKYLLFYVRKVGNTLPHCLQAHIIILPLLLVKSMLST